MVQRIGFMNWEITCSPAVNSEIYEKIAAGGADQCACSACKNYSMQREIIFPPEILELFQKLGIDYRKEVEVCHYRIEPGVHEYQGWFHLVGELVSKRGAGQTPIRAETRAIKLMRVTDDFRIGITSNVSLMQYEADVFGKLPVLAVEFAVRLPWLLEGPEQE